MADCEYFEYKFLTNEQRERIDKSLDTISKLDWYEHLDSMLCYQNSDYYIALLFPSQSSTYVETPGKMHTEGQFDYDGTNLKKLKNTSGIYRPYYILRFDSRGHKEYTEEDESKNDLQGVNMYSSTSPMYKRSYLYLSTVSVKTEEGIENKEFKPTIENAGTHYYEFFFYVACKLNHKLKYVKEDYRPPGVGSTPEGGGSGQTNNQSCSNTGQFGGGGIPLKDIKLFLYANNVTKGTIKLSKPQVEVGTFATDWRPNPSDYVERNSPAYKEVKGLAIQHNQDQNKKYIEVQATDGTVYGIDIWGGDAKKLLEQQQAEIEELKKLVKTLELKINV